MLIAYVPLIIALVGILVWILASNVLLKEAARIAYFVGLFWLTYSLISKSVKLL